MSGAVCPLFGLGDEDQISSKIDPDLTNCHSTVESGTEEKSKDCCCEKKETATKSDFKNPNIIEHLVFLSLFHSNYLEKYYLNYRNFNLNQSEIDFLNHAQIDFSEQNILII
jgi:hypothetical protein